MQMCFLFRVVLLAELGLDTAASVWHNSFIVKDRAGASLFSLLVFIVGQFDIAQWEIF